MSNMYVANLNKYYFHKAFFQTWNHARDMKTFYITKINLLFLVALVITSEYWLFPIIFVVFNKFRQYGINFRRLDMACEIGVYKVL